MSTNAISNHDVLFTGFELRDMGASATDEHGIQWLPPDQGVREQEGSVALRPDPESVRLYCTKRTQALADKAKLTLARTGKRPANALNRMMRRPVVKGLMNRLYRRGLITKEPNTYAELKQPALKIAPVPKLPVTPNSTRNMSVRLLRMRPFARTGLKLLAAAMQPEPTAGIAGGVARLLGPKSGRYAAYNYG